MEEVVRRRVGRLGDPADGNLVEHRADNEGAKQAKNALMIDAQAEFRGEPRGGRGAEDMEAPAIGLVPVEGPKGSQRFGREWGAEEGHEQAEIPPLHKAVR